MAYSPEKRKRCVLRVGAGEVLAEVARQERVDEKTVQRWCKADLPKGKAADKAAVSEKSPDVASRGNVPEQGLDPKIEAALGKAGAASPTAVKPEEIAAQKALTLEGDTAFCLSTVKTAKAVAVVTTAPFFMIAPTDPRLSRVVELAPHTIETIKANAGPFAAELRKVIGDSLYLVYMALLAESVMAAFSLWTIFRQDHPKKPKAEKEHEAAHQQQQEGPKA